jgi:hypothetical protein
MLDCVARSVFFLDNPGLWPGFVAGTLSAALILAALLTPLLLWGYGRRVTALMNVRGAPRAEPGRADEAPAGPIPAGSPESAAQALARARSGLRRSLAAASLGILAYPSTDLAAAGRIFTESGVRLADAADEAPARPDVARVLRLPAGDPDPAPILRQLLAEPAAGGPAVAA